MHFSRTLFPIISLASLVASSPLAHNERDVASTSLRQPSATTTTSSDAPCPTTPEAGTYCGFVNPEDPCAPQPGGQGPSVVPDTVSAFTHYTPFQSMSLNNTYTPGYTSIFTNLTAAANLNNYLGLNYLDTYSPSACAAKCNEAANCTSFNVYIERDPSQNPTKNDSSAPTVWGYWCPNPPSITNFVCALWADAMYNSSATNHGQYRGGDFEVVIVGSNGFVKNGVYISTNYWSGMPASVPTSGMPGPSASGIVAFTGAAGRAESRWMWSAGAFVVAVLIML
ncbi:unnamed protein product [Aureobasidium vineae]|uniref:Apple domain-containing protein n=1 Tax=Aureobasidium vineae TaxID=2773715 RepID=A0A9N8P6T1_9PEZI|nr:unnamed protein product [Aureobasidium vineae]